MLTSKQRAYLKSIATNLNSIFQVGKSGVTPDMTKSIDEALEAREIVKITVLNNCSEESKYIASILSERTHSEVVQIIGKKIVLYRESKTKPTIELPKK